MQSLGILEIETNDDVKSAYDYFEVVRNDAASGSIENGPKFSGYNEYGMVDFYGVKDYKLGQGSDDLNLNSAIEALSNILIAAVLRHAGENSQEKVKPENWRHGFNEMCRLFFSDYLSEKLNYNEKKAGKDVVESIIRIGAAGAVPDRDHPPHHHEGNGGRGRAGCALIKGCYAGEAYRCGQGEA